MLMPPGRGAVDFTGSRDVSRSFPTVAWTLTPSTSFRFAFASPSTASTAPRFFSVRYRMVRPARLVLPVPPLPATAMEKPIAPQPQGQGSSSKGQGLPLLHATCYWTLNFFHSVFLPDFFDLAAGHLAFRA